MDIATSCFTCKGIFRGRNPQTVECSMCKNILHRSCLPPLVKNQFNCSNQCVNCFVPPQTKKVPPPVPPKKKTTQKEKVFAEKAFDHQRLEKEKENQIIVNKVSPLKNSVIVSDFTLSVESEISNQTSKIVIVSDSTSSVESEVSNQTSKMEKISFEQQALLEKEFFSKAPSLINNKNLKICFTQYINGYVNYDCGFSVYPNLAKEDFQVKKIQFKTAENQISGTSVTSELVMGKNDESNTGDFKSQLLKLGDHKGNHFNIALRNVSGGQRHIEDCLHSLRNRGFLNYFSSEFGLGNSNSYLIGKELVFERWQKAIDLILEPMMPNMPMTPMLPMLTPSSLVLACFVYKSSRDVLKAVSVIDENQMDSVPSKLLFSIEKHGENLAEALNAVPLDLRKSYVHSYLGLIWNKIVSKRIAKFGVHLIIGDLVYDTQHNQVILLDDGNKHKFTIYDVVLPLPGPDTIYPDNVIANWYDDLFKWDWLPKKNFNRNSKIYGLDGVYRYMIIRPSDFKWKFVRYNGKRKDLICSDSERLGHLPVDVLNGRYVGLVLEFNLPTFAFASMALREMLKMDISNTYEKNQLDRSLKLPLAANGIIINQPQIQKTDENPCRITAPTPEINNFFFGRRPAAATNELSQSSPLRKINLESGTLDKQPSICNLVEQPIPCPPSTNESQPKESPLEKMGTIQNLQPATKNRSHCSHPPFLEMITKAVIALKELNGSSRQAILQYILANFQVGINSKSANRRLKQAFKRGVTLGTLEHIGGAKGAAGSFRLSAEAPKKVDKKVKPVAADKEPKMVKKAACPKKAKAVSKKTPAAATRKQTKKTQVKKKQAANERPAAITKDSTEDPQKIKNQTPLRVPFKSQECPAANDNLCRINEQPVSEINNSVLHSPSPLRKVKLESGTLDKPPSMDSLVEQSIPCPPSTNESQLKERPLEMTDTIQNLQPAPKKPSEETQVKKEPTANVQPALVTKDSSEELQKNRNVAERSTSNQMPPSPPLSINESLEEPQTKCVKEEPGISRTRSSTLIESCAEEPAIKKIKTDPDAKLSNFKSIIYIDLLSDEQD